jgi:hypothetical protein
MPYDWTQMKIVRAGSERAPVTSLATKEAA